MEAEREVQITLLVKELSVELNAFTPGSHMREQQKEHVCELPMELSS